MRACKFVCVCARVYVCGVCELWREFGVGSEDER